MPVSARTFFAGASSFLGASFWQTLQDSLQCAWVQVRRQAAAKKVSLGLGNPAYQCRSKTTRADPLRHVQCNDSAKTAHLHVSGIVVALFAGRPLAAPLVVVHALHFDRRSCRQQLLGLTHSFSQLENLPKTRCRPSLSDNSPHHSYLRSSAPRGKKALSRGWPLWAREPQRPLTSWHLSSSSWLG